MIFIAEMAYRQSCVFIVMHHTIYIYGHTHVSLNCLVNCHMIPVYACITGIMWQKYGVVLDSVDRTEG